jgi:hypothetical protein
LAGLIDRNGHFSNTLSTEPQLIIVLDSSLVYKIKEKIGYGNAKKNYILVISNKEGLIKVLNLINGKLRIENKYYFILNNILNHKLFCEIKNTLNFN